ncbi:MAG: PDZ domain-containing protein [Vampirovibrionales bacterium]
MIPFSHRSTPLLIGLIALALVHVSLYGLARVSVNGQPLNGKVSTQQTLQQLPYRPMPTGAYITSSKGYVGIDLEITPKEAPIIKGVFPGSPAARAGLTPGTPIVAADGQLLGGLTRQEIDDAISDQVGHVITFLIATEKGHVPIKVQVAPAPYGF